MSLVIMNLTCIIQDHFRLHQSQVITPCEGGLIILLFANTQRGRKTILLKQLPATPTNGQGVADKSTLISNGNTVTADQFNLLKFAFLNRVSFVYETTPTLHRKHKLLL